MSAKFLHVFADERQELQKQIGCMAGIFRIFDRQHILLGSQLTSNHRNRLSSGHAGLTRAGQGAASPQIVLEGNRSKSLNEKRIISMESSRTSFSSSSCSSFSSLECNTTQQESPSFVRSTILDENLKSSQILRTSSAADGRPSDSRDSVKDSINRDLQSLSVKTSSEEDVKNYVEKHIDSPWTMQLSKSVDRSYMIKINGISREAVEVNDSELKEVPWNFPQAEADSLNPVPREVCRFSYQCLDSRENIEPASELRDLPGLSLDSREGCPSNSSFDAKPSTICKDLDSIGTYQRVSTASNLAKELDTDKRSANVVAKLMGLEAMPSLISPTKEPINSSKGFDSTSTQRPYSSKASNRLSCSPNSSFKDPGSTIKPVATPRVPIETPPWKKQERIRIPRKTSNAHREAQPRQQPESIYSEIEKRLKELEFRQSNKDLRALKQILETMQAKGLLETKKGDYPNLRLPSAHNSKIMESRFPKALECPIVIIRPGNSVSKSEISPSPGLSPHTKLRNGETMDSRKAYTNNRMVKDCIPKSSARENSDKKLTGRIEDNVSRKAGSTFAPESSRPKHSARENKGNPVKTLPALNPGLRQKRPETERKSRSSLPTLDSSRPKKTPANRQQVESVSPRSKLGRKPVEKNYEQLSECSEMGNSCCQGDEVSQRSGGNVLTSQVDIEVTSADRSADTNSSRSPSGKAARKPASVLKQKKPSIGLCEQVQITEISSTTTESPSPISVLDSSFYQDDLPTSLKKSPDVDKGAKPPTSGSSNSSSEISHKKLQRINHLVQKLSELTSSDETDHIAALCETRNPDHHYASEILLASGLLLEDLSSAAPIQLHPSGHPINPDLFLVLEQTSTPPKVHHEKLHRKLMFDVVNEVLVRRMEVAGAGLHVEQLVRSRKLAGGYFPSGQQLLKELCLDIDRFGAKNFGTDASVSDVELLRWSDYCREVAGAVLEIEKSIFKDLIDEVVKFESGSRRRQLFP